QAEDGIRDIGVTGVQTCALPISSTARCCWKTANTPATCPAACCATPITRHATPSSGMDRIPVLDIAPFLAGAAGAAAPLADAIARTCEDTGFLVVAGHGIAPALVEGAFAGAARFFAQDEAKKLALKIGRY